MQQILQTVRKDFRTYLLVRFATGMRSGEIDGLKWRYIDFERRLILVRETVVKGEPDTTKTYESTREIEISQAVCDALRAHRAATGHLSEYSSVTETANPSITITSPTASGTRCYGILTCGGDAPTRRVTLPRPCGCQRAKAPSGLPGNWAIPRRRCSSACIPVSGRTSRARTALPLSGC